MTDTGRITPPPSVNVEASPLRAARAAAGLRQREVADRWGRAQTGVVRIEQAELETLQLGTLRSYVQALGGRCRIIIDVSGETIEI